ncbi:MAG TPA: hypothetical protein VEJ63_02680 [Planctomycetota bacterium]|nr:hypothetical protein [Planctomycetota bacterium]
MNKQVADFPDTVQSFRIVKEMFSGDLQALHALRARVQPARQSPAVPDSNTWFHELPQPPHPPPPPQPPPPQLLELLQLLKLLEQLLLLNQVLQEPPAPL